MVLIGMLALAQAGMAEKETATRDTAFFVERMMTDAAWLAPLPDERVFLASSHQPVAKRDCNTWLRDETEAGTAWKVLVDLEGPGMMTRFWTAGDYDGALEIWVDGVRALPNTELTLDRFFSGRLWPGPGFTFNHTDSSGGRVSYVPVPFNESLKIRTDAGTTSLYWQITYSRFDKPVVRFKRADLQLFERRRFALFEDAKARCAGWLAQSQHAPLAATHATGSRLEAFTMTSQPCAGPPKPGVIRAIAVSLPPRDWPRAGDVRFQLHTDGREEPDIDVPLPDLAHMGAGVKRHCARHTAFDGRTLYFAMPIPYGRV